MKTTLIIPDRIFRELKRRAGQRRATLSDVVAETLLRGLNESTAAKPASDSLQTHSMGAPTIDLADRDALYRTMEGT